MRVTAFLVLFSLLMASVPAVAETPVLAVAGPRTGTLDILGPTLFQSVRYAMDEINQQGGLLGQQITLLELDTKSTPEGSHEAGIAAARQGAVCVIGPTTSTQSIPLAEELQKAGIPMLAPTATAPAVTRVGDYIFRVCFSDTFQGRVLAHFATRALGLTTAAILGHEGDVYSDSLSGSFTEWFENYGGTVVSTAEYRGGQTDFSKVLEMAEKASPQILVLTGHATEVAKIISQAREMGIDIPIIGGDGWASKLSTLVDNPAHLNACYEVRHFSRSAADDKGRRFLAGYERVYGPLTEVDAAVQAYDAVLLWKAAVIEAASFEPEKVKLALHRVAIKGVTGNIQLDKNGDPEKPARIVTYQNGEPVFFMVIEP